MVGSAAIDAGVRLAPRRRLTAPSSGHALVRFACLRMPLIPNVGRSWTGIYALDFSCGVHHLLAHRRRASLVARFSRIGWLRCFRAGV